MRRAGLSGKRAKRKGVLAVRVRFCLSLQRCFVLRRGGQMLALQGGVILRSEFRYVQLAETFDKVVTLAFALTSAPR